MAGKIGGRMKLQSLGCVWGWFHVSVDVVEPTHDGLEHSQQLGRGGLPFFQNL